MMATFVTRRAFPPRRMKICFKSYPVLSFLSVRMRSKISPFGNTTSNPNTLPLRLPYRNRRNPPRWSTRTLPSDTPSLGA